MFIYLKYYIFHVKHCCVCELQGKIYGTKKENISVRKVKKIHNVHTYTYSKNHLK